MGRSRERQNDGWQMGRAIKWQTMTRGRRKSRDDPGRGVACNSVMEGDYQDEWETMLMAKSELRMRSRVCGDGPEGVRGAWREGQSTRWRDGHGDKREGGGPASVDGGERCKGRCNLAGQN